MLLVTLLVDIYNYSPDSKQSSSATRRALGWFRTFVLAMQTLLKVYVLPKGTIKSRAVIQIYDILLG